MFMDKNELLKYVNEHYLTSGDFNGVAVNDKGERFIALATSQEV